MTTTTRIQTAIADSIRETRIVTLTARVDTQEWADLADGLAAEAEDWTDAQMAVPGAPLVHEYWGSGAEGEWRVHLAAAAVTNYEVRPIVRDDEPGAGALGEPVATFGSLQEAEAYAERHALRHVYGYVVIDRTEGRIHWGNAVTGL